MKYERNFYQIRDNDEIFNNLRVEIDSVGYYSLHQQDIGLIQSFADKVKKDFIYVIGIGGSTLGTKAIYTFLRSTNNYKKSYSFLIPLIH